MQPLLWLQALVIVALAAALAYFARDELPGARRSDDSAVAGRQPVTEGAPALGVRVNEAARQASGIEVSQALAYTLQPHREAFGNVVSLLPLFQIRSQLQAASAEQLAAQSIVKRTAAELQRTQALYADEKNVSQRALQTAESDHASTEARLAAAIAAVDYLQVQLRQNWGATLAAEAGRAVPDRPFLQLLEDRAVLVQIFSDAPPPATIQVSAVGLSRSLGDRVGDRACVALYVSPAPQVEPGTAGFAHYYRCAGVALPVGARILALLPLAGAARQGVRVPGSALVWQGGKPWIYLQRAEDRFERHDATGAEAIGDDWFIAELPAGVGVVTAGAQILLSEENRYQIKNENED
jgi:hypothetical protein